MISKLKDLFVWFSGNCVFCRLFCVAFFRNKNIYKKPKLRPKNAIIDEMLTCTSENWILTKIDRKQINVFERNVYRRILGPVYEKENWRILTIKEIYAMV